MRYHTALPFDDDIVDCVLCRLPNFKTLKSTILASRGFMRVFDSHKISIMREICHNYVGPFLPLSLRALRLETAGQAANALVGFDPFKMPDLGCETNDIGTLTFEEILQLVDNAKKVHQLEIYFSFCHKDGSSPRSTLTNEESLRFQRAVYDIALFIQLFPPEVYKRQFTSDEVADIRAIQVSYLESLFLLENDLRGIYAVYLCLYSLLSQSFLVNPTQLSDSFVGILIALGPYKIQLEDLQNAKPLLAPLEGGSWGNAEDIIYDLWINPLKDYLHHPLRQVMKQISTKTWTEFDYELAILDTVKEGPVACEHSKTTLFGA
ncbi:hypothetical protein BDN72DRAFT_169206 [Pluteus cervinus]|uniref:Uncharacterized protein n=1 Tax=Pluteus cervinus TaxID=181527 RepID=A0ACD3B6P3_9AGAR|nr:hypothetical protein BDN72DRAFT_169206 [Pluteus cervinus]